MGKNKGNDRDEERIAGKAVSRTVEALSLPKDVALAAMIVTVTGKNELYVENYNNIIEFNESILKLQGKNSRIAIEGKNFVIHHFSKNCLELKGRICEIKYF